MKHFFRLLGFAKPWWHLLFIASVCLLGLVGMNLISPWLVRELIALLGDGFDASLWPRIRDISILLFISFAARAIFRMFHNYLAHKAAWNLVAEMRVRVYDHLQKLSLRFYHDKQTGQLMSRTVNDTATFEVLIAHVIPDLSANLLILVGVTVLLFLLNPTLTLLTFLPVPFLLVGGYWFAKRVRPNFRAAQRTLADLNAALQDNISGMKEIQVFNQQQRERGKVRGHAQTYANAILKALKLSAVFHPAVEMTSSMGTVIVVAFGGMMALQGTMQIADIVAFLLYLNMFYQPITTIGRVMEDLQQGLSGAERVFEVLDTESEINDSPNAVDIGRVQGEMEFRNVSFHYQEASPVLKNISFTVKSGQMLALVGPTGVGKTTIISLMTRFYDPVSGSVHIDGHNLKDISLASLRSNISMVLQDVFLFTGTVSENIAWGDMNATKDDIENAARLSGAEEFILKLSEGYDTKIGERGIKLSGGQKQRLAIARAILRDTPILILDEATASVDVETESRIQEAIQNLAEHKTVIVIAHRLSTVQRADCILVIEEGTISEAGTHQELFKKDGTYTKLCKAQFHEEE